MLTMEELIKAYWWPFPPEEGWQYDPVGLAHWIELTTVPARLTAEDAEFNSSRWLDVAARSVLRAVVAQHATINRLSPKLPDVTRLHEANVAVLADFTDGLLASPPDVAFPPSDDLVPSSPPVYVLVGGILIPILPTPPTPPPHYDEPLDGIALTAIAIRCGSAASAVDPGPLRDQLTTSRDRLFDTAQLRLK